MVTRIKAIPTIYRGTQFRSRLEATWAADFDSHRVTWIYEAQGFERDSDGLRYLPDFFLPETRTVVEVKGLLGLRDVDKLMAFVEEAHRRDTLVIIAGPDATWSQVIPGEPSSLHPDRRGLDCCATCGAWQFWTGECRACRVTSRRVAEPKTREDWIAVWRWWSVQFAKMGRSQGALDCAAEAMRLEEGGAL